MRARHFYTSVARTACTAGLHVNVSPALSTLRAPLGAIEFLIGETHRFNAMEDAARPRERTLSVNANFRLGRMQMIPSATK